MMGQLPYKLAAIHSSKLKCGCPALGYGNLLLLGNVSPECTYSSLCCCDSLCPCTAGHLFCIIHCQCSWQDTHSQHCTSHSLTIACVRGAPTVSCTLALVLHPFNAASMISKICCCQEHCACMLLLSYHCSKRMPSLDGCTCCCCTSKALWFALRRTPAPPAHCSTVASTVLRSFPLLPIRPAAHTCSTFATGVGLGSVALLQQM
ncbi:hypothetical protein COO60DRAFT_1180251 [Scenedesmus sp. NREL 46B-D3]|nr:hypothetical protein COO60DRAFT_1180251 [Scenedesmus sp. NREL 46B-D3]